jgi:hypothetical protein
MWNSKDLRAREGTQKHSKKGKGMLNVPTLFPDSERRNFQTNFTDGLVTDADHTRLQLQLSTLFRAIASNR